MGGSQSGFPAWAIGTPSLPQSRGSRRLQGADNQQGSSVELEDTFFCSLGFALPSIRGRKSDI